MRVTFHKKLVTFMAAVEVEAPQIASHVFCNMFGGGTM